MEILASAGDNGLSIPHPSDLSACINGRYKRNRVILVTLLRTHSFSKFHSCRPVTSLPVFVFSLWPSKGKITKLISVLFELLEETSQSFIDRKHWKKSSDVKRLVDSR